ncbi:MAG: fumarylacetoacetate hydrolase family protein [Actinobacteria bacterium]|nr:fumarylacetoacetate hydrolase family protein [Actinomycetota bacterium]
MVLSADPTTPDHLQLFPEGTDLLEVAIQKAVPADHATRVPLSAVRLLPPLHPGSFRDFVAFEEHVQGASAMSPDPAAALQAWAKSPTFLFGNPHAMVGAHDPVVPPPDTESLDFELEVGVVIGRDGRDLSVEEARDHIVGYLVVNDWSARDIQTREMKVGLGPAKGKDFATTIGPWLVTPDELESSRIGDRHDLRMRVSVNDTLIGEDSLAHMAWSFPEFIAHASRAAWVRAGDLIASGTCHAGALSEFWGRTGVQEPPPLCPGDVVTMTVDGLGTLRNRVAAPAPNRAPVTAAAPLADLKAATGMHA